MQILKNQNLTIKINPNGAELTSLFNNENQTEYIWNADPAFWGKSSPVLFPIVGSLKENSYCFEEQEYTLPRHGFARDSVFIVEKSDETHATFLLTYDENTLKVYPFKFEFRLIYSLENDTLNVTYFVRNIGENKLYFSVGGHPAFTVPLSENTSYDDELKKLSPVLKSVQAVNVFEVPTGYFENLSNSILKKVKAPSARIINFQVRNSFLKYAAAAIITGVIAIGALRYSQPTQSFNTNNTSLAILDESIEKGKTMNDQQFEETLQKLTATDIAKYLENNGDITDVAILGNSIDENNLPNEDDYILDEKTLDNFIKEVNNNTVINN
jgi:hypothetical protein